MAGRSRRSGDQMTRTDGPEFDCNERLDNQNDPHGTVVLNSLAAHGSEVQHMFLVASDSVDFVIHSGAESYSAGTAENSHAAGW